MDENQRGGTLRAEPDWERPGVMASGREPRVAVLSAGGQLLVWSMRQWLIAVARRDSATDALAHPYRVLGCQRAVAFVDECLALAALAAMHPLDIRCLCDKTLSSDEALILRSMQRVERKDDSSAVTVASELVAGPLAAVFVRSAALYVRELNGAGLRLASEPDLRLVPTAEGRA